MDLHALLGDDADGLLNHTSKGIVKEDLHLPGPDFIDRCMVPTDRSAAVLRNLGSIYGHGRLAGTGYVSILPVDQGIEHSAAASLRAEPDLLRPGQHRAAWRSKAAATPSPPHSGSWPWSVASTRTRSPSS